MALKHERYTYHVTWSEEDQEYVGLCSEFPSLSWLDESAEKALAGIRQVVADVIRDMQMAGERRAGSPHYKPIEQVVNSKPVNRVSAKKTDGFPKPVRFEKILKIHTAPTLPPFPSPQKAPAHPPSSLPLTPLPVAHGPTTAVWHLPHAQLAPLPLPSSDS